MAYANKAAQNALRIKIGVESLDATLQWGTLFPVATAFSIEVRSNALEIPSGIFRPILMADVVIEILVPVKPPYGGML